MKLVKLKVSNFMSIGNIDLDLDRVGMNLILGKNVDDPRFDSNGSAKSALFEAMTWGLFGEFLRELSAESVIRIGTDKVTVEVLVDPEDGTDRVWFTRTRTKKEHTMTVLTETGVQLFPANSVKDIQPQINSWLGLDFRTFTNSVYFGKGLVKFFMASNDGERKELLETILQLVSFDDALERSKGLAKKCNEDIANHNTEIAIANALHAEKNTTLSTLVMDLSAVKQKYEKEQPILLDKKFRATVDRDKIKDSLARLDVLIDKEKVEYETSYNNMSAHHVAQTAEYDNKLKADLAKAEEHYNGIINTTLQEKVDIEGKLREGLEDLEKIHDIIINDKFNTNDALSKTEGIIQNIENERSHINGLTENLPCKECRQNISVEHKKSILDRYNEELKPLYIHVEALKDQLTQLDKNLFLRYERPYKALTEKLQSITSLYTTLVEANKIGKNNALDQLKNKNTQDKMEVSKAFIEATKNLQEDHHKKTNGWVVEKAERQVSINNLNTEIDNLTRLINDLAESHTKLYKQVEDTKKDIDRIIKQQNYAKEKIEAIEMVRSKTEFWIEGFGPRGIKSFVFEAALPYLTARTNHYSTFLTGGTVTIDITPLSVVKSTGNVKEKLNVSAVNSRGANVYNGNSDGERRRIDICVLLALQDLISTRASKVWNTLIFDEIFDALDKTGIEHVVDMFRTFKGKSIYIISHSEDIKKHFDTAVIVQKKDGVSTIKEIV